jgi:hypothetical protein
MKKFINDIKIVIAGYFKKKVLIPTYEYKRAQINQIRQKENINVLVETGTFLGDTIDFFKAHFKKLYSIELAEDLAREAQQRFVNDLHVSILQGDSGKVLKSLINEIHEPALFWLDGHYSSEFFIGDKFIKTGKGEKDTPVEEELNIILNAPLKHFILIDDARLFVGENDYPSIKELKKLVSSFRGKYELTVENDIIYILPN